MKFPPRVEFSLEWWAQVLRIINEPTAAAVAYGLDKKAEVLSSAQSMHSRHPITVQICSKLSSAQLSSALNRFEL